MLEQTKNKILILLLLILISILVAGAYGILHDQITYTLSEEYYTKFKFPQFELGDWYRKSPEVILPNPRLGVAFVGFMASWWVGFIVSCSLGIVGLIHKTAQEMFHITLNAILLNVVFVFIFGVLGFLLGELILSDMHFNPWIPDKVLDRQNFVVVGWIHNFGYLGGLVGLIEGIIYSVKQKNK